jgi:23S rRNA (pseudouridine1915-N3)-methyltransferase
MEAEFLKRLRRYAKVEVREVPASKHRELPRRIKQEGEALERACPKGCYRVVLDLGGKEINSPGLARLLEKRAGSGQSRVAFFIGGSDGLPPDLLQTAQVKVSFSRLTFPHQLFRIMLLEQIYRAFTISRGEPYHK